MENKEKLDKFDIVIPVGPNDEGVIDEQIKYTKKNIIGYRNIYVIPSNPEIEIDGCITVNEDIFPFSKQSLIEYRNLGQRVGWYLAQLIKLYAGKVIPNILETYLVIDADTFFIKPTTFIDNNKCMYSQGMEYQEAYFEHMKKMHPSLKKPHDVGRTKSGICHHMMFQVDYFDKLVKLVEDYHGKPFYEMWIKCINERSLHHAGAADYEIYYNFMMDQYRDKIIERKLAFTNVPNIQFDPNDYQNCDFVSCHHYCRRK